MAETERQLIARARKGDAEAYGTLYDRYVEALYRFIALKVRGREAAEDLTHEVFLVGWQKLPSYHEYGLRFSSWLYRIARNKVIDHYRRERPHDSLETLPEAQLISVGGPAEEMERGMMITEVRNSLTRLNDDQRDVVIMRFIEGLTHEEIAEILGKTQGAVRLIQHRALENLRQSIDIKKHEYLRTVEES